MAAVVSVFAVVPVSGAAIIPNGDVVWPVTSINNGRENGLGFTVWHVANPQHVRARMDLDPNESSFINRTTGDIEIHATLREPNDPADSATLGTVVGIGSFTDIDALIDNSGSNPTFTDLVVATIDWTFSDVPSSGLYNLLNDAAGPPVNGTFTVTIYITDSDFTGDANSLTPPASPGSFVFWAGDDPNNPQSTSAGNIGLDFHATLAPAIAPDDVPVPEPASILVWLVSACGTGSYFWVRKRNSVRRIG